MTEREPVEGGLAEPDELEPEQGTLALLLDGPPATRADWEAAAAAVLRKARRLGEDDPDDAAWRALTRTTYDGVDITPLGTAGLRAAVRTHGRPGRVGAWDVRAHLDLRGEPATANSDALADLEGGVTSLWVEADGLDVDALDRALDGVLLDLAPVVLGSGDPAVLERLLERRGVTPAAGTNLGADPFAGALRDGTPGDPVPAARTALRLGTLGVVVDGSAAHDLGATEAQELGWSMAAALHDLRRLTEGGVELDAAVGLLEFRYAVTDDQLLTTAKLRAARRLWARVLEVSGAAGLPQRQHAVTSRPMLSKYDPYTNLLRTTVAAFAAAVGGADAITVLPFDQPLGRADAFARRIARNTSALLIEESHVAVVTDPAGGSYVIEQLTDDLAQRGWEELQRIEKAGGAGAALRDGSFLARVEEAARRRRDDVAHRRRPITGLSEFPDLAEKLPERDAPAGPDVRRWGADFEALRDAPAAERVYLATLGTVAAHTARATFVTNLLAAGGVGVATGEHAGQRVVCVAGTDAAYDESGAELAAALRAGGATRVIVAGVSTSSTDGYSWADDSCATGDDAIAFLTRTREALA